MINTPIENSSGMWDKRSVSAFYLSRNTSRKENTRKTKLIVAITAKEETHTHIHTHEKSVFVTKIQTCNFKLNLNNIK